MASTSSVPLRLSSKSISELTVCIELDWDHADANSTFQQPLLTMTVQFGDQIRCRVPTLPSSSSTAATKSNQTAPSPFLAPLPLLDTILIAVTIPRGMELSFSTGNESDRSNSLPIEDRSKILTRPTRRNKKLQKIPVIVLKIVPKLLLLMSLITPHNISTYSSLETLL